MRTLTGCGRRYDLLAYSPDGREVTAADSEGDGAEVWSLGQPVAPRRLFVGRRVAAVAFMPTGGRLVAAGRSDHPAAALGLFVVLSSATELGDSFSNETAFATNGDRLLTAGTEPGPHGRCGRLTCRRLIARGPGKVLWRVDEQSGVHLSDPVLLPDGRAAVPAWWLTPNGIARTLRLHAADTGRPLAEVVPPGKKSGRLVTSSDGEWLVLNGFTSLYVWRVADLPTPPRAVRFDRKPCNEVAFHPDGRTLLAADNDGTVHRLDVEDGRTVATYSWKAGKALGVAVSPDGLTAAVGTDKGQVIVFDLD